MTGEPALLEACDVSIAVDGTTVKLPGDAESAVVDFDFAVAARATMAE